MTDYRWYYSDALRDIEEDIFKQWPKPEYINVCGCPLNHVILSWRRIDFDYIFTEACKTEVSVAYTIEEFMALNKKDTYCYPFSNETRDLEDEDATNVEVCSCPKKHTYTYSSDKSPRLSEFHCDTKPSWDGSIAKLLDNKIEVKPVEDAKTLILTPKEEALVRYARSTYEAPPDKNIIAALMMTQWIRAQRMPFESDRLIELYDAPKKKGIV